MSYQYRKAKRILANLILAELAKIEFDHMDGPDFIFAQYPTANKLKVVLTNYSHKEINAAADLLYFNKHIQKEEPNEESPDYEYGMGAPYLVITSAGVEAFNEGFYDKENDKDKLETFKLRYDLYFPILSLILSILAAVLSVITIIHTWNKK
jgi:hypothetical protein